MFISSDETFIYLFIYLFICLINQIRFPALTAEAIVIRITKESDARLVSELTNT